ncbi:MAG TPA: trehalose-phosphatase [Steroidobacteraceae bacterium]
MDFMADTGMDARPPLLTAAAALYLDFDGTLAAFAPHPDGVTVDESLGTLLAGLRERLGGAVALVTGRTLASLDALIAPNRYPGAGVHGLELRLHEDGATHGVEPAAAASLARELRQRFADDPRIVIEDKGAAVALHYRRARGRADECIAAMRELVESTDLEVITGHAVVEARPPGVDKGGALRSLSASPPFADRWPVFVGDDVTDEDGFRAAAELGGFGVKVGPGASIARYRIAAVGGVYDWLRASLAALTAESAR